MTKNDLERLIEMHGNAIYRFCYHLTGCRDDADDLYQDTLCKAYEIRKRIENLENNSLLEKERNYCMGIAIRLYKNIYRKKVKRKEESLDNEQNDYHAKLASNFSTEEQIENEQMKLQVRKSIQSLPLKQRTVIYLFYYADLSIKDISILLLIPVGTVKSRLSKAKSVLKKELEEIWYE
jgi:RNA polymerase sigma-70 factor (ECF subfamily)